MSNTNSTIQLELPEVHGTKDLYLRCRVTRKEMEKYKALAVRAGYVSVSDLLRAGISLVQQVVEAQSDV